jgi:hypothetical protein
MVAPGEKSNSSWTCGTRKRKLRFPASPTIQIPTSEFIMSISKCIVRLKDCHDSEHSVEVYAESLYEAILRGLSRLQDVGWESDANETTKRVEVEIHQEPTRHIVDVPKLLKWVKEDSMYPAQQTRKVKLRKLISTASAISPDITHRSLKPGV